MTEKPPGADEREQEERDDLGRQSVPLNNDPTLIMAGDDPLDEDAAPLVSVAVSLVGQTLSDRYAVEAELGRGGMGVVYKGRNRSIDRAVAIKVLDVNLLNSNNSKKRFELEAKASANLEHPNLVSVFDYGFGPNGEPYIVMELLNGVSLDKVLKKQGPFSIKRFSHVFKQVCKALGHVHKRGLIHRDIKPGNIMLISTEDDSDFVKLVDFGIAKVVPQDGRTIQRLTATGQSFGSPLYMSPEQCMGMEVDKRSDVYSLGCVMYEMLTGVPPIQGENPLQTLFAHVNCAPMKIADTGTDSSIPPQFEAILMKMLEKKPDDRYQSVSEVQEELARVTGDESSDKSQRSNESQRSNVSEQSKRSELSTDKRSDTTRDSKNKVVPSLDGEGTDDTNRGTGSDTDKKTAREAGKDKASAKPPNTKLLIPLAIAAVVAFFVITPMVTPFIDKYHEDEYQKDIAQAKESFDREHFENAVAEYRALRPKVEQRFGGESKQMADLLYRMALANRKNDSNPADSKQDLKQAKDILEEVYEEHPESEQSYGLVRYELGRAYEASDDVAGAIKEYEEALKTLNTSSADRALISEIKEHLQTVQANQSSTANDLTKSPASGSATGQLTQVEKPYQTTIEISRDGVKSPLGTFGPEGVKTPFVEAGPSGVTIKLPPSERAPGSLSKRMVEDALPKVKPTTTETPVPETKTLQLPSKFLFKEPPKLFKEPPVSPFLQKPAGAAIRSRFQQRIHSRLNGEAPPTPREILEHVRPHVPPPPPFQ